MKTMRISAGTVAALLLLATAVQAQEKAVKPITPLTVQVVFNEYEGEKKISSLPYMLAVNANERPGFPDTANLRMGVIVPISTDKDGKVNYEHVGTNIDCKAESIEDGRFRLHLNANRSSLYTPPDLEKKSAGPEVNALGRPMLRRFDAFFSLLMRDGQTIQSTMATDAVSGRVWKVEVTLRVVKGQD